MSDIGDTPGVTTRKSNRTEVQVAGAGTPTRTRVWLNGVEVYGVQAIEWGHNVNEHSTFKVTVLADPVNINSEPDDDW